MGKNTNKKPLSDSITSSAVDYPYPAHVNVSNFVTVKLTGKDKYFLWETQMVCLMKSHDMYGFVDGTFESPETSDIAHHHQQLWERSDNLLKGWIFGSLDEKVLATVAAITTASGVWEKLQETYSSSNDSPVTPTHEEEPKAESTKPKDVTRYLSFYKAALKGNWEEAQDTLNQDKDAATADINLYGYTALHFAIGTGENFSFVERLLEKIPPEELPNLLTTAKKYTVLHLAAIVGNTKAAEILVKKNEDLLYITDVDGHFPIHRALFNSMRETFLYLLKVSRDVKDPNPFKGKPGATLLYNVIFAGYYGEALELVKRYPDIPKTKAAQSTDNPLFAIAKKDNAFPSGSKLKFWERLIYKYMPMKQEMYKPYETKRDDIENRYLLEDDEPKNKDGTFSQSMTSTSNRVQKPGFRNFFSHAKQWILFMFWEIIGATVPLVKRVQEEKLVHHQAIELLKCLLKEMKSLKLQDSTYTLNYSGAIVEAATNNTYEVVQEIVDTFPQSIWCKHKDGSYLIQLAILNRCEKVYSLFDKMSGHRQFQNTLKDSSKNNLLHLAGKLAPPEYINQVSGAALQMQRELQWYRKVETFVHPKYKREKNSKNETPWMVFTREHKELVKAGEEWTKKIADSYTIIAGLITTIVFAAAITVPGGNNQDTGFPFFDQELWFKIFAISDAISLFTSTTSLLLFLSILTARYAELDFLVSIPKRLIFGLATLFISTTSMMIAFTAALYLLFGQEKAWVHYTIGTLTCLPITSFVTLQYPLLADLIYSTYGPGIFRKHSNRHFY